MGIVNRTKRETCQASVQGIVPLSRPEYKMLHSRKTKNDDGDGETGPPDT
ncbi:hypothetical protein SAMN00790413_00207 [Deinococcus hopiensis KR-140]|uniref:Uncharacterized protein n=1 Tax=Deinococcus hopiensis KR-140 TaxID=695939 RepID=A0A1W1V680_9DEIO|nr:hypothetical protein SAMN00790413_00207 [Deinococcus hopiensis KR-140]